MIASQQSDSVFVHGFKDQNIQKSLNAIESTIDIISHKKVISGLV